MDNQPFAIIVQTIFRVPKQILIASNNSGKLIEISDLLSQINVAAISPPQNMAEPEENGADFAANSLIKACYYAEKCNMIALADDSGLCVEALDGEPGIYSARFATDENGKKNFALAFDKIKQMLLDKHLEPNGSKAYFICNLTIFDPQTKKWQSFEGRVDGHLAFEPRGLKGFGYDPIFVKNGMTQTFGEIEPALKDKISHRAIAFAKFLNYFNMLYS